jgi:hypothetical protein
VIEMADSFPFMDRPTPVVDVLKQRPTVILDAPIVAMAAGGKTGKSTLKGLGLMDKIKSNRR